MRNLIHQIKNFFYWGWTLRKDYDWDHQYLIQIMNIKLTRMKREMLEKPNYYQWTTKKSDRGRKALIICADLSKRLLKENSYYMDKHIKKHPKHFTLGGVAVRAKPSASEHKEFMRAINKDKAIHKLQNEMFFNQLQKWHNYWWT